MTTRITRKQWSEITSRVHAADYSFNGRKCLIDGRRFQGNDCLHDAEDNRDIIKQVQAREAVAAEYAAAPHRGIPTPS